MRRFNSLLQCFNHAHAIGILAILACMLTAATSKAENVEIDLIRPIYRGCIYATEKCPEIVARINLPKQVLAETQFVLCRLLDANQKEIATQRTTVDKLNDVRLPAESLAIGDYQLVAQALGKDDRELASATTKIRKLPPPVGNEVRIDEHRNILVNGKPQVFIGWYGGVHLEDPRPDVVALQNLTTPNVIIYPNKKGLVEDFQKHGIHTIVELSPGRLINSFNLGKHPIFTEQTKLSAPSEECIGYIKKLVEMVRDEPAVVGWYISDEPEINNVRVDYLEAMYHAIAELDPYHPIIVTNDTLDGIEKIGYRCCDILAPDPYSPKPNYVPSFMQKANSVMRPGQSLMITPWHACADIHFSYKMGTQPAFPYHTLRSQILAATAYGARGFAGYTDNFFMPEPRLRYGLPHVWREVRFLEAAMAAPPPAEPVVIEPAKDVVTWLRQSGDHVYAIVMNYGPPQKFTLRHPALTMSALPVVSEGREVAVKDGAFTDELATGETHVYSTDPRGRTLATTTDAQAEITAEEQRAIKPGNLLHVSRGVAARTSKGTLPWFAQIQYYAINGVTDDLGWHVTHAVLPQWLELSLPSPQTIGRVVVHTPNLKDYDLQFRGSDGSIFQAEVRDNTATVAEHRLEQPVESLKIRIIAHAVRPGIEPKRSMVREIEAYSDPGNAPPIKLAKLQVAAEPENEPLATAAPTNKPPLWLDDFASFQQKAQLRAEPASAWTFNPQIFKATHATGKHGVAYTSTAPQGNSYMTRLFPYAPEYRFFQINIPAVEGDGYRWAAIDLIDPARKNDSSSGVITMKPGRYTIDTHNGAPAFANGDQKEVELRVRANTGVQISLDHVSLNETPTDGLVVTMEDGSPLPAVLKEGDQLRFRLYLSQPATDAVVELSQGSHYVPVRINGEPYVQLIKSGLDKDGRYWSGVLKLGPGSDKFKINGYPLLVRAVITGGSITETMSTFFVDFE
jgi:hypothetical protein